LLTEFTQPVSCLVPAVELRGMRTVVALFLSVVVARVQTIEKCGGET